MGRKIKLKPVNNVQQQLSRGLRQIYGPERVKKIQQAEAELNSDFVNLKSQLKADSSYVDYPNANAALQSSIEDLQDFLTAGKIGPQQELIYLEKRFEAALAQTDEQTRARLQTLQIQYKALIEGVKTQKQKIDADPYAASYIAWQRLESWKKQSPALNQGFEQFVFTAGKAMSALDSAYRPKAFKPIHALPEQSTSNGWEANLKNLHNRIANFESVVKGPVNDTFLDAIADIDQVEIGDEDFAKIIAKMERERDTAIQAVTGIGDNRENKEKEANKENIRQEWAPKIEAVRKEQENFNALKTAWQNYRGKDFAQMQAATNSDLFPKEITDTAQQFTHPVSYDAVSKELLALQQNIQNVKNTDDIHQAEQDIAERAMQAVSKPDGAIAKLLSAPGAEGSSSEKYAQEIKAYCRQFIAPMQLVQHCYKTQQTFKAHYEAIAADLQKHQFRDDQSYQAAVSQRLKDHRRAVEADLRLLDLDLENRPADDPLKPKIKEARTALEAEIKKCDDLFAQQRTKINEANDKLELQILTWSAQNVTSLAAVYEAAFREKYPKATQKECELEVVKYAKQQTELRANFAAGRGIPNDVLETIKQIDINKEFAAMHSLELGDLPPPGSFKSFLRNKLNLKFGGITVEMKVTTKAGQALPGKRDVAKQDTYDSSTFYINIKDKNPTPESKEGFKRFLRLLAAQGRKPPAKPIGKVVLSKIKRPGFLVKISSKAVREEYYLNRALFYAKIAQDNKVPFEVTDPNFAPGTDLRTKFDKQMEIYRGEHNEAVNQYAHQLSQAVVDQNITIDDKGTLTGRHGITNELPKALEEKGFNEVTQFVAHRAVLSNLVENMSDLLQVSHNDFLDAVSAQPGQEQSNTQAFKGKVENTLEKLDSVIKKVEDFENNHPDSDLTNVIFVAHEQWAQLQLAREILDPKDRTLLNAGRLHRLGEKLFQGPSAEIEKQLALETACLKLFTKNTNDIRPLVLLIKGSDPSKYAANIKAAIMPLTANPRRLPAVLKSTKIEFSSDNLEALHLKLAKDYCDILLENNSLKTAAPPSNFQREAIDSNNLSPREFAAAAQGYFTRLEKAYEDAMDSAGNNQAAKIAVEAKFTAHLAAQEGELKDIKIQQPSTSKSSETQTRRLETRTINMVEESKLDPAQAQAAFEAPDFASQLRKTIQAQKNSGNNFATQMSFIKKELSEMADDALEKERAQPIESIYYKPSS